MEIEEPEDPLNVDFYANSIIKHVQSKESMYKVNTDYFIEI